MLKPRGGTAVFQVETGRWQGVKKEDRVCKECNGGEVEDVTHWLLRCSVWSSHCQPLLAFVQSPTEDEEGTAHLLSCACIGTTTFCLLLCQCGMLAMKDIRHAEVLM